MTIGKKIRNALVGVAVVCGVIVVTLTVCRHAPQDGLKTSAPSQDLAALFPHERRAALATDAWGGMRVDWTAVVDWPTGDSPAANSVRLWIDKSLRNYRREPFNGDIADWDAMTRFYGNQFIADNGSKAIESDWRGEVEDCGGKSKSPDVDPGEDVFLGEVPKWFCNNTAIIEYEDERIVSYRAGFSCISRLLADTNVVFELVRELAKVKFKEGADIYETGIPIPAMPLFTNEGFWCFWGDYAIVEPHVYEMKGEFPSLFVPWRDPTCGGLISSNRCAAESLLLPAAKSDLGLGGVNLNQ